jgi:hypothetical protein
MENVPNNSRRPPAGVPDVVPAYAPPEVARRRTEIDPGIWSRPQMRRFLAYRNIGGVFRLLQQHGVSQRAIAARTDQSQSEIAEIISGRQVVSYEVLVRIADGLRVPRGWMGLAFDEDTARLIEHSGGDQ